jgi:DEAD/DEAH box helicase domain-containing protein
VHPSGDQWQWTSESYPADAVSLRSISSDNFVVVDTTRGADVIGETSFTSGPATLHEKAIYMVEGALYQVERLDFEGRKAYVRGIDCDYYTEAITYTKVTVLEPFATGVHAHGEVHVSSRVVGFKKIKFYTNENVGSGELDLPEQQMHTTAYWLTIPAAVMAALPYASDDRRDGVVGLACAMRQVAQLLLMCDRQDIGISIDDAEDHEARLFVYDNYPGGIGFSEPLFAMQTDLVARTRELIAGCDCEHGCPTCVGPLGQTGPLAKVAALRILEQLMASSSPAALGVA